MTEQWKMDAYREVAANFHLKAEQRDMLDETEHYEKIMQFAHDGLWSAVGMLLMQAEII